MVVLSNKARFITETLSGSIDLRRKKREEINKLLIEKKYNRISEDDPNFNYLVKMPMDSVSEEAVEKLMNEKLDRENELELLTKTTIENMWLNELAVLKKAYNEFCNIPVITEKKMVIKKKKK